MGCQSSPQFNSRSIVSTLILSITIKNSYGDIHACLSDQLLPVMQEGLCTWKPHTAQCASMWLTISSGIPLRLRVPHRFSWPFHIDRRLFSFTELVFSIAPGWYEVTIGSMHGPLCMKFLGTFSQRYGILEIPHDFFQDGCIPKIKKYF